MILKGSEGGEAARKLSPNQEVVPIISGNVGFTMNLQQGKPLFHPRFVALGDVRCFKAHRMQLTNENAHIFLVGKRYQEFSETEFSRALSDADIETKFTTVPQVRFDEEQKMNQAMLKINQLGLTEAVHDISQGGLWQALVEMVAGDRNWPFVGLDLSCPDGIQKMPSYLVKMVGLYVR